MLSFLNIKTEKVIMLADAFTGFAMLQALDFFHKLSLVMEDTTRVLQLGVFIITAYKLLKKPTRSKKNNE